MFRRPRAHLVASLSGAVLLICAVGALAAVLLLGHGADGARWAAVALLAAGAALVTGHLVDLVLPRPQLAAGVPRGLTGLVTAVLAGAAVGVLGAAASGGLLGTTTAAVHGGVVAAVAAFMALAASYIVVEATAVPGNDGDQDTVEAPPPAYSPWSGGVLQVVFPLAACAPVALALQAAL
jgi:membrane-bound ClpP family serine protease